MTASAQASFEALGLDYRVLRGIEKKGLSVPTQVQSVAIPAALEGKDITARAHTGTGKTLAYLAPAVHALLQAGDSTPAFSVIVLVPTSELCEQVKNEATTLAVHCAANIRATVLATDNNKQSKKMSVTSAGQIVVATPGRLAKVLHDGTLPASQLASSLKVLILDEADLLLTYGYEADLQALTPLVPRSAQRTLMSATASEEVSRLASLMLHDPVSIDLTASSTPEAPVQAPTITHTYVKVESEAHRLLSVLALLRLGLVAKKMLLFVNSPDMAYRVRLLLEAFGVRAGTLVSTLPLESRQRAIEQFNAAAFDVLVAAEAPTKGEGDTGKSTSAGGSAEYGVTRGVDFKGVRTVVNVENPAALSGYTHRVGRTGRAGAEGLAISLVGPKDGAFLELLRTSMPEAASEAGDQPKGLQQFYRLKKESVEVLRYRGEDVLKSLTKRAVRDARARDLKLEILNCSKLQDFFETHESDASALKNDKQLTKHIHKVKHLRQMPDYLKVSAGVARGGAQNRMQRARGVKRKLRPEDDPLRGASKFTKDTEATEMEVNALKVAKKTAKKQAKAAVPVVPKVNVRKRR